MKYSNAILERKHLFPAKNLSGTNPFLGNPMRGSFEGWCDLEPLKRESSDQYRGIKVGCLGGEQQTSEQYPKSFHFLFKHVVLLWQELPWTHFIHYQNTVCLLDVTFIFGLCPHTLATAKYERFMEYTIF